MKLLRKQGAMMCLICFITIGVFSSVCEAQHIIKIKNDLKETIWVTGAFQAVEIKQAATKTQTSKTVRASIGVAQSGAIDLAKIGISSSTNVSGSGGRSSSNLTESSTLYEIAPFIKAGEQMVGPGTTGSFAVNKDIYYLSVRTAKDLICANLNKSAKTDSALNVYPDGIAPFVPRFIRKYEIVHLSTNNGRDFLGGLDFKKSIASGAGVNLKLAAVQTSSTTSASSKYWYKLDMIGDENRGLYKKLLADNHTYWDKDGAHKAGTGAHWQFQKVNSPGFLLKEGDKVQIVNKRTGQKLIVNKIKEVVLGKTSDSGGVWTISRQG